MADLSPVELLSLGTDDGIIDSAEDVVLAGTERLYETGEKIFGVSALAMFDRGWMTYPQERDERRTPGRIDGRMLRWSQYQQQRPSRGEMERWAVQASASNTAIILGPASGDTFVFDADIYDQKLSLAVRKIIAEELGESPLRRVGQDPKVALFYRYAPGEAPQNAAYHFVDSDGDPSQNAIEILSVGKSITAFGRHHKTGKYFQWLGTQPKYAGPEAAPIVTAAQLSETLARIEREVGPFHRNRYSATGTWETVDVDGIRVPRVFGADKWTESSEGLVINGRDAYLWSLIKSFVKANPGLSQSDDGKAKLRSMTIEQFRSRTPNDGRWLDARLKSEIWSKLERAAFMLLEGRIQPYGDKVSDGPVITPAIVQVDQQDDTFSWIKGQRGAIKVSYKPATAEAAEKARLKTDRTEIATATSTAVAAGVGDFLDDVYGQNNRIHVLRAPTGAGKTTAAVGIIADDPRTKMWDGIEPSEEGVAPGPFVFLLPTYANIDELRGKAQVLNLDPSLDDVELKLQAAERGIVMAGEDEEAELARLRLKAQNAGLNTMVYRGKIPAGCKRASEVTKLMDAGIGTAGLCKSRVRVEVAEGEKPRTEEILCSFYSTCGAIKQRLEIPTSHIVFMPRPFLTLALPEELKNPRGVICDEYVFDLLVHHTTFDLSILDRPREPPRPTKVEKEAGFDPMELLDDRKGAVAVVKPALLAGRCPAAALKDYSEKTPKAVITGLDLAKAARRVCGAGIISGSNVTPDITVWQLDDLVTRPVGKDIKKEHRFWSIVVERIEAVMADEAKALAWSQPSPLANWDDIATHGPWYPQATGDRDYRIQLIQEPEKPAQVRISWRTEANWSGIPTLLLDASADTGLIEKIFPGRDIVVHDVPSDMNTRTLAVIDRRFSVRSMLPGLAANAKDLAAAATLVGQVRETIATLCGVHANGRVVFGMPKKVRKLISKDWFPPANADFLHTGAEAGLDFARQHVAVVAIGRQELPVRAVDGMVAALTYRDISPELPIDKLGTGVDDDGKDIRPNTVTRHNIMRDGQIATYAAHEHAGNLARRVQGQAREEKTRQLGGRLRAVFREDTTVQYICSQSIPSDVVLDDIRGWRDLQTKGSFWDAVRLCEGIIDAELMTMVAPETGDHDSYQRGIGKLDERVIRNYHRLFWTDRTGAKRMSLVPGFVTDPAMHMNMTLGLWGLKDHGEPTGVGYCQHQVLPADIRPACKMEAELGDRYERLTAEWAAYCTAVELVTKRGEFSAPAATTGKVRAGTGEYETLHLTFGAWQALSQLTDPATFSDEVEVTTRAA